MLNSYQKSTLETMKLPLSYCKVTYELYKYKEWFLNVAAVAKVLNKWGYSAEDDQYWDGLEICESRFESECYWLNR